MIAPATDTRTARRHETRARLYRDQVRSVLDDLSDADLSDLVRIGRYRATPDGWPGSVRRDGMPHGKSESTSVERAGDVRLSGRSQSDPRGVAAKELLDELRVLNNRASNIRRLIKYLAATTDEPVGCISSLPGDCLCCTETVSGARWDRLKRGLCNRCYCAWRQWAAGEPEPSMPRFIVEMAEQVAEEAAEARSAERRQGARIMSDAERAERVERVNDQVRVSRITGRFVQGVGEVAL